MQALGVLRVEKHALLAREKAKNEAATRAATLRDRIRKMSLIVIVDDRITNRNIFAKLATSIEEDVAVRSFGDPAEALEWLKDNTPDLVVTDYKMPNMDGAEFVRRFRRLPECSDIPAVVITVYEERTHRINALEAGATDFLQSPVDHHEFLTRARNLLKLRKQQLVIKSRATELERELMDSERFRKEVLRDSRERLAQVIDTVPALISATDRDGRCVFLNAFTANFYGVDPTQASGKTAAEIFGSNFGPQSAGLDRVVFKNGKGLPSYEEEIIDRAGHRHVFLTTKSPLRDRAGKVVNVLTTSLNITERKQAEEHLHHLAHHDPLTGLPNRTYFHDSVRKQIARTRRGDKQFALLLLDLDRFKGVNDVLGHHQGDQLLKAVAQRLSDVVRETDTVARLGGDEFAILQTEIGRTEDAVTLAEKVIKALEQPFELEGQEINTTASVGITVHPNDGVDVDVLLKNADLAMYQAKAEGRNAWRVFASDMHTNAREAIVLESDLRQALAKKQFLLNYQPQIDLRSGRIIGAEALLRWRRPGAGLVRPGEFLPLAEENGLIVPINEWVLFEACAQAKLWSRERPGFRIAVNLSPVQFRKQDIRQHVLDVLEKTGLNPSALELELTESILMQNPESAASDVRFLQELGVTFSIDDFGVGYSSLSYVKNLPVDRLKIDQGFIRNVNNDPNDAAIVRAIINLGHSLNLKIMAEGVETAEQLAFVRSEGCDEVQGFYFSPPVPAEDFEFLFSQQNLVARTA
jgi:diguanylate cyclase (GGDEF)-like protein/PAS domain S-box-containing protein